ncbi:MAG: 2-oxo acid dehydrogenase subunit E2 [Pseudomonadota bacterium]|nr:2-oxo acid dehydrogenase subunit E2 [Pseudomonadota bacterium]
MGQFTFKLPDVGEGTAEAEIVAWHVAVGDRIEEDQPLVDVMTDKATVEMTTPVTGRVVALNGELGEMAAVGSALAVIEVEGEGEAPALLPLREKVAAKHTDEGSHQPVRAPSPPGGGGVENPPSGPQILTQNPAPLGAGGHLLPQGEKALHASPPPVARIPGAKPLASPAVRRRAHEAGVALQFVPGTGPAGRIGPEDLEAFIASGAASTASQGRSSLAKREGVEEIKVIGLRRKIAEKMQDAKRRIPHFAYVEEIDATELESLRVHLNATKRADQPKLTVLPFIVLALVRALPRFPQINARFDDEAGVVHRHAAVHAGIATQTPGGLIVPVVRHAEARDVWDLAAEIARLAAATREGKVGADELKGSTITVTSLGPLGGVVTTPVINHPEVAIVGPNKIVERPVVLGGQIAIRKMMNLSSSFDHRVVDGYDAAAFIQVVRALLEHPATLFMDSE